MDLGLKARPIQIPLENLQVHRIHYFERLNKTVDTSNSHASLTLARPVPPEPFHWRICRCIEFITSSA